MTIIDERAARAALKLEDLVPGACTLIEAGKPLGLTREELTAKLQAHDQTRDIAPESLQPAAARVRKLLADIDYNILGNPSIDGSFLASGVAGTKADENDEVLSFDFVIRDRGGIIELGVAHVDVGQDTITHHVSYQAACDYLETEFTTVLYSE